MQTESTKKISTLNIVKEDTNTVMKYEDYTFKVIKDYTYSKPEDVISFSGVILDYSDPEACRNLLSRIRASENDHIFLKPVFLMVIANEEADPIHIALADGSLALDESIGNILHILKKIQRNLSMINTFNEPESYEDRALTRLLKFLFSREQNLNPVLSPNTHTGYGYPVFDASFERQETYKMFGILNNAVAENYFSVALVDKLHLCSHCYCGFLNYRETCPKCSSIDLVAEETIHHFVCAYIGPESDFKVKDELICPKCTRKLRHIGTDYDKPSLIHTCNNCNNMFQEPDVRTKCTYCHSENELVNLVNLNVYSYKLTTKGKYAAIHNNAHIAGIEANIPILQGTVSYLTFSSFTEHELERVKAGMTESSLGLMELDVFDDVTLIYQNKKEILRKDVTEVIKSNIGRTDVLCYMTEGMYLILFSGKKTEDAQELMESIRFNLSRLLQDNLNGFSGEIKYHIYPVLGDVPYEQQLQRLISESISTDKYKGLPNSEK